MFSIGCGLKPGDRFYGIILIHYSIGKSEEFLTAMGNIESVV